VDDVKKLKEYIDINLENSLLEINVNTFENGELFIKSNIVADCDVVFLDIFMDEMNGIEVARLIRQTNTKCLIVFVSTSNSFAVESYGVQATDYLLKPYDYQQFEKVMDKVNGDVSQKSVYFTLKNKSEDHRILLSSIIYIDYFNHYVKVHTDDGVVKSYLVTFDEVQKTLSVYKNIIWCYRNILVNMDKIAKTDDFYFILSNGENIPINRDKVKEIKNEYRSYLFKQIES
ncbi:MAG: LytTR family DNA-binding domain-containing protein, partial [Clostridia bacterium]